MPRQPNIVFILIDDMGWRDLSCYGSTFYDTPTIDRLFAGGMHFTNAYAACPVCSPTRASILTGTYPANIGITDWIGAHTKGILIDAPYVDHIPLSETTLAAALRNNGYTTWHVGKWHVGGDPFGPTSHGFDVNIGGCFRGSPHQGYFSPWGIENLTDGPRGEYLTDRLTDEAIALIESHGGSPFYLNMWYYSVHTPTQAPAESVRKYERKAARLGLDQRKALEAGEFFPTASKRAERVIRRRFQSDPVYAAMIECLDRNIGRLLSTLESKGVLDNTLIVFTSDNGGLSTAEGSPTCNAPLSEGKGWMYEGGVREPLIVAWPEVVGPGSVCEAPVTSPDFFPTLLEAAGIPLMPEQHRDGVSMMPLLKGGRRLEREAIYWHYPHYGNQGGTPACSMRMGDHKLIQFFEDNRLELYNLSCDIGENDNRASSEPELVKRMHAMLQAWRDGVHARIPEPNPEWNELE